MVGGRGGGLPPARGVEPRFELIRGGTDGSRLSERGLPTPNIFTGGQEYHSLREWASVQDMAAAAATVVELVQIWGGIVGARPGIRARGSRPARRSLKAAAGAAARLD